MGELTTGNGPAPRDGAAPWPRPVAPRASARSMYRLHRLLRPNRGYRWLVRRLDSSPRLSRLFTAAEERVKADLFGCRMCGQCTLPVTGYACPMSCPKELRNGPCGGVRLDGGCEVYPERRCVWLIAYERAAGEGRVADLLAVQRPLDHRGWGASAWVGYWRDGDDGLWRDGRPPGGGDR
jgi:hypothetical protein